MKIVINSELGGFGLSNEAVQGYADRKGISLYAYEESKIDGHSYVRVHGTPQELDKRDPFDRLTYAKINKEHATLDDLYEEGVDFYDRDLERDDPALVSVVEDLGERANSDSAHLKVVEIPDDIEWEICEYDGAEHIQEKCRKWC